MFYPADPDKLRAVAGGMLEEVNAAASRAIGAIVPHAGLIYSGQCAAHVWKRVSIPRILVVLAPNHTGALASPGASAWSQGRFETPFGDVPIAERFLERVSAHSSLVRHDPSAHTREHAIEVELPFVQLLAQDVRLAPIVLAWDRWDHSLDLATALAAAARESEDDVLLVASSDMTHYESAVSAEQKDRLALAAIERLDGQELLAVCRREGVTMCGRAPAAVVLEAARQLGAQGAELVDYRHSGWVTGNDREVVAYAGVVIR
jgi:AmmeMemoRadiSam system protein B